MSLLGPIALQTTGGLDQLRDLWASRHYRHRANRDVSQDNQRIRKARSFRLGRLMGAKGPGIVFIAPIINRMIKIDLRERYLEVPHQTCITKDNAPTDIDFLIYFKVIEATQSVVQVQNFEGASIGIATTTLRAVVGDIPLDELLAQERADQPGSADEAGRSHRALGNQGYQRRNSRNQAAAGRPRGDG